MARPGPKSKKQKPGPKSKKLVEKEDEPVHKNEESEDDLDQKEENDHANDNSENEKNDTTKDEDQSEEDEDEPPAKKGRGGKKASKATKKSAKSKTRKTPGRPATKAKKEESSEEEDEKEYEVDYIIEARKRGGKKEYLIKWKGYRKDQSTWEPEDNLNCDEAIQKFEEKMEKLQNDRSLRENRKETERYVDVAGTGDASRRRHSRRNASGKAPRKSYREEPDDE